MAYPHKNTMAHTDADSKSTYGHAHPKTADPNTHTTNSHSYTIAHSYGADSHRHANTHPSAAHQHAHPSAAHSDLYTNTRSRLRLGHDVLL